jgi:serine/threonine protein kinase
VPHREKTQCCPDGGGVRIVGAGAFGVVVRAHDRSVTPPLPVVLKLMVQTEKDASRQSYQVADSAQREVKGMEGLHHENVVRLLGHNLYESAKRESSGEGHSPPVQRWCPPPDKRMKELVRRCVEIAVYLVSRRVLHMTAGTLLMQTTSLNLP